MTNENMERFAHIPDEEIQADIRETEREIALAEREAAHLEATPRDSRDFRLNDMKAAARRTTNEERRQFIAKLQAILDYRVSKPVSRQE